jgi:phenylalanine-4-hydroxylase
MVQDYNAYTTTDRQVWNVLYSRQRENLSDKADPRYLACLDQLLPVMNADKIPNYDDLNAALEAATGWSIHVVPGLIPVEQFFELLAQRKFPASTWLRKPEELDYLEEPDMFHDIFGHIPLLLDPQYAQFMEDFGKHGVLNLKKSHIIRQLQNLYWFTIEFGVCGDPTKIYGAGIISSFGETKHIFAPETTIYPFDLEKVLGNSFINSEIQGHYYRFGGLEALYGIDFKHIH